MSQASVRKVAMSFLGSTLSAPVVAKKAAKEVVDDRLIQMLEWGVIRAIRELEDELDETSEDLKHAEQAIHKQRLQEDYKWDVRAESDFASLRDAKETLQKDLAIVKDAWEEHDFEELAAKGVVSRATLSKLRAAQKALAAGDEDNARDILRYASSQKAAFTFLKSAKATFDERLWDVLYDKSMKAFSDMNRRQKLLDEQVKESKKALAQQDWDALAGLGHIPASFLPELEREKDWPDYSANSTVETATKAVQHAQQNMTTAAQQLRLDMEDVAQAMEDQNVQLLVDKNVLLTRDAQALQKAQKALDAGNTDQALRIMQTVK